MEEGVFFYEISKNNYNKIITKDHMATKMN